MSKPFPVVAPAAVALWHVTPPVTFADGDDADADADAGDEGDSDADVGGAEAAAAADAKSLERQARAQGWRPEAEFKGEGKWVDAATFVERGNKFKKNLEREVESLKAEVAEGKKTREAFAKFHKEAMERKEKELDTAIRKAKLDRSEAIRNGEDSTALELDDRIDVLKDEKAKLKEAPVAQESAEATAAAKEASEQAALQEWVEDGNEWFRDNHKLRAYAMAIGQEMRAAGDKSKDRKFLDKIRAQMEDEMPEAFGKGKAVGNPLRNRAASGEVGSGGATTPQGRSERDLPADDRALMQKFVKDGLLTKEQFLKDYKWSN